MDAVEAEIEGRRRKASTASPTGRPRRKHLLSGLIKYSECGSSYVISGEDYYRCAGQKERGTCGNIASVRETPLEAATLNALQHGLLTDEHARLFVAEFERKMARLTARDENRGSQDAERLAVVTRDLDNLTANLLAGVISPTLTALLQARETEKAALEARLAKAPASAVKTAAAILPHPTLLRRFEEKVGALRATLDDPAVRGEAAEILATLIESVTIYPGGRGWPGGRGGRQSRGSDGVGRKREQPPSQWRRGLFYNGGCGDRI